MIVATYDLITDKVRVIARVNRPALWSVRIWIRTPDGEKEETTLRPRQRCFLADLLPMAHAAARELVEAHPAYTAGGFQVVKLR